MKTFESAGESFDFYRTEANKILILSPTAENQIDHVQVQNVLEQVALIYSKLIYSAPYARFLRLDFAFVNLIRAEFKNPESLTATANRAIYHFIMDFMDFLALFSALYSTPYNGFIEYLNQDGWAQKHRDKIIAMAFLENCENPNHAQQINAGLNYDSAIKIVTVLSNKYHEEVGYRFTSFYNQICNDTASLTAIDLGITNVANDIPQKTVFFARLEASELQDVLLPMSQRTTQLRGAAAVWEADQQQQIAALTRKLRRELAIRESQQTEQRVHAESQAKLDAAYQSRLAADREAHTKAVAAQQAAQHLEAASALADRCRYASAMATANIHNHSSVSHRVSVGVTVSPGAGGAVVARHDIFKGGRLHASGSQELVGPRVQHQRIQAALAQPRFALPSQMRQQLSVLNGLLEQHGEQLDHITFPTIQFASPYGEDKKIAFLDFVPESAPKNPSQQALKNIRVIPQQLMQQKKQQQSATIAVAKQPSELDKVLGWVFNTALNVIGIGTAEALPLPAIISAAGATTAPVGASAGTVKAPTISLPSSALLFTTTKERTLDEARTQATTMVHLKSNGDRCQQLRGLTEDQLAWQYNVISTNAYDSACLLTGYVPDKTQRGRHIHDIAAKLAIADKIFAEQCSNYEYPFSGIETCYKDGHQAGIGGFCFPGSVRPDLYSNTTGVAYDHKTGLKGTPGERHERHVQHVPSPESGVVSTADVTMLGVQIKYATPVLDR